MAYSLAVIPIQTCAPASQSVPQPSHDFASRARVMLPPPLLLSHHVRSADRGDLTLETAPPSSFVRLTVPKDVRGRVLALIGGVYRIGGFVGPFIGGLLAQHLGFRWPFFVQALMVAASLPLIVVFMPAETPEDPDASQQQGGGPAGGAEAAAGEAGDLAEDTAGDREIILLREVVASTPPRGSDSAPCGAWGEPPSSRGGAAASATAGRSDPRDGAGVAAVFAPGRDSRDGEAGETSGALLSSAAQPGLALGLGSGPGRPLAAAQASALTPSPAAVLRPSGGAAEASATAPEARRKTPLMKYIREKPLFFANVAVAALFLAVVRAVRELLVPLAATDIGLSKAQVGFVTSLSYAIEVVGFPAAGWMMDKMGRKAAGVASQAGMGAAFFVLGFLPSTCACL